ncbi:MAG TPA: flagellar basal body P-ring protein FlgI [Longimicrobiaceae bacterium]
MLLLAGLVLAPLAAGAQEVRIRDLTLGDATVPVRLVGYGLVTGLDGTGDRGLGARGAGQTVQSVANLLRRFDVEVPAEMLRTRNVAAVLVTAEVSPYLRAGARFNVAVSSVGDARSLRGGVLWMTPLVAEAGGTPVATAQGALLVSDGGQARGSSAVETTARSPEGGLLEGDLPRPAFAQQSRLVLREPDLGTATRIAAAVNGALGAGSAAVEDPGAVALTPRGNEDRATLLARVGELRVRPDRPNRLVIDGRDGTVVAGGDMQVGEATVSHGAVTLTVGAAGGGGAAGQGGVQVAVGTPVVQVAAALQAVLTPPSEIAAIFESLRAVGAISAEVVIR